MSADTDVRLSATFRLLEQSASTAAERTDRLFAAMLLLSGGIALGLCLTVLVFAVRYRQGSPASRKWHAKAPVREPGVEIAWAVIPLVIFIALFVWSALDFVRLYRVPANALPVYVVAKQWMWTLQHRNGRREINELHVPQGEPVRLVMTSQDAIHSFFVPAFRLKQDVLPGRYTGLWFTATEIGEFPLYCAEYCGSEHSQMLGRVVVLSPDAYARWLDSGPAQPDLAQYGFARFRQLGCSGCHAANSTVHAPELTRLFGRTVHLQDGRDVVADENYVRDSILLPRRDVVAGYEPLMPSYAGQVSEDDLRALIAYLRSLQGEQR